MLILTNDRLNYEQSTIWIKGINTYSNEKKLNENIDIFSTFADYYKKYNKLLKYNNL